jgi:hypothetical protein
MRELAAARHRTRSKTKIRVAFHRYLNNFADELAMRSFAESLGFEFQPLWAYLMPLEKNLAYLGEDCTDATITAADEQLIDRLALHPRDASDVYGTAELDEAALARIRERQPEMEVYPMSLSTPARQRRGMRRAVWLMKQADRTALARLAG